MPILTFGVVFDVLLHNNAIFGDVVTCQVPQVEPYCHGLVRRFNENESGLEWSEYQY